jgi:hypothetical protein
VSGRVTPLHVETRFHRLERLLAGLPAEANALWDDLRAVKQHLSERESALLSLEQHASALQQDLFRCGEELGCAQRRGAQLVGQLVAITRLQSTLERSQVLQALEEVVASLVGCEEMALFEPAPGAAALRVSHVVGISAETLRAQGLADEVLARSATGALWLDAARGAGDRAQPSLTACVPLQVDGGRVGALALFRLLEHKPQLEPADVELLELLGVHAAVALLASRKSADARLA